MAVSKAINISTKLESDTYQHQRSSDPIKYGEMLVCMQEAGLTQQEIADKLSCHRQMVGRYQRIGKWPAEVKEFIHTHREKITNTKILNFASRALSDKELLTELKTMIGEPQDNNQGELIHFPSIDGINELIAKLEAIEQRLLNLETSIESVELNRQATIPPSNKAKLAINSDLTWAWLLHTAVKPCSVLLMICITILTAYLVYQGMVFFSAIDPNPISAISSSVISELVPFLSAACFALATKWSPRLIALLMLLMSIVGLGFFMHKSISSQLTQGSGRYERLIKSRELALASIATHMGALATLPDSHVSKRQEITNKIGLERAGLANIDSDISALESSGGSGSMDLNYALWIRIAAMLLNAYLIHLFFSGFRRKEE